MIRLTLTSDLSQPMKISARTEYAYLALMHLAEAWASGEPVQIRRIAEEHGIPPRFLVQILAQLKGAGLVASVRGAGGGYLLNRPPHAVTLLDVLAIMEGDDTPTTNCAKSSPLSAALLSLRHELCQVRRERLESLTLADLAEQATATAEPMWYI